MHELQTKYLFIPALLLLTLILSIGLFAKASANQDEIASIHFDAKQLIEDLKFLSSDEMKGRNTGTPESEAARNYVLKRFKESGIKPVADNYLQKFSFADRSDSSLDGVNIVGLIKGKVEPNKYIVITAHYDHVGVREGEIYNGADDNASGTSALFAIGKYFNKNSPDHSIIFVAFDAEERGLQGARYFVDNLPVKHEEILLNINMDMIARSDKGELYAAGTFHYPNLKPYLDQVKKIAPVKLLFGHDDPKLGRDDWTSQSDHGAFHRKKIPFIYFGVEDHKDYHKPTDDFENIQPEFYVKSVETILEAVISFDGMRK